MVDRDDWTWEQWGQESIGWRLGIVGRGAGRLLLFGLKSPFLVIRMVHPWVKEAEAWGILLAAGALSLSLVAFWINYAERVEERTVRAWQLLTTPAPGNSGKREALEYLNRRDGLWCQGDRCLVALKHPTELVGIDLSPPDRGEIVSPDDGGSGAYLMRLELPEADLYQADLGGAYLFEANLYQANLGEAILERTNLFGAELEQANLYGAILRGAMLNDADLGGAFLYGADLEGAHLVAAVLLGADLERAALRGAYLYGADLKGADLSGADLSNARGLTQAQLNSAIGDQATKIPEFAADGSKLTRPEHWGE